LMALRVRVPGVRARGTENQHRQHDGRRAVTIGGSR